MKKVIVIGGGASGMMAAIHAAEAGARVTVLEENSKPLRKLLVTGNGRCNLTNLQWDGDVIRSTNKKMAMAVIEKFNHFKVMEYFHGIGIVLKERSGWIYPQNDSAAMAAKILIAQAQKTGVKIKTNQRVTSVVKKIDGTFDVNVEGWIYNGDAVIAAVGTGASINENGHLLAEDLAEKYNLKHSEYLPALTSLKAKDRTFLKWAGVRTEGVIRIFADKERVAKERGEIQLTESGISGIPVFQVSRYVSEALKKGRRVRANIDFLPMYSKNDIAEYIEYISSKYPERTEKQLFCGLLPEKLAEQITGECVGTDDIIEGIKNYKLNISATGDIAISQVCMGGISLTELSENMECIKVPGLFFAGEAVDVDGTCGGYNLQWAWSSGKAAGEAAAK